MDGKAKHTSIRFLPPVIVVQLLIFGLPAVSAARNGYVPNHDDGSVSVIDTATSARSASEISVGNAPAAVAITPDGSRAYVTNTGSRSVSLIDTSTNTRVGNPIEVGTNPNGVVVTPDGSTAYVTNKDSNTVSVIDTSSSQVTDTIDLPAGSGPFGIAVAQDGEKAYVVNYGTGDVSVIDTETNILDGAPIHTEAQPTSIAITPDGSRLYVTNQGWRSVSVIDIASRQEQQMDFPIRPDGIAITPDGSRAYVTSYAWERLRVLDTATNQWITEVGSPGVYSGPRRVAITPDGLRTYIVNASNHQPPFANTVSVIDNSTNTLTSARIVTGRKPYDIAIQPNQGPAASFTVTPGKASEKTTFDASASTDSDGTVAKYEWSFNDGSPTVTTLQPVVTHVYQEAGNHSAVLTVTDNEGGSTEFVSDGRTAYHNGGDKARTGRKFDVEEAPVTTEPEPEKTISTSPVSSKAPLGSCTKYRLHTYMSVDREVSIAGIVKNGFLVEAKSNPDSGARITVSVFSEDKKKLKLPAKTLASADVSLYAEKRPYSLNLSKGQRRALKVVIKSRGQKTMRIRTRLDTTDNNGLKRDSALTSRVRIKGKRLQGKFEIDRHSRAKVVCDERLITSIKSTRRSSLKKLAGRGGRPGHGVTADVTCSENCSSTVSLYIWGRDGRRILWPGRKGKSAWKLLVSKDVVLSAEKMGRVTLSIKSKRLRRKLSRAYRSSGNPKVRAKLMIRGKTASGVRDYSSQTVTLRVR